MLAFRIKNQSAKPIRCDKKKLKKNIEIMVITKPILFGLFIAVL